MALIEDIHIHQIPFDRSVVRHRFSLLKQANNNVLHLSIPNRLVDQRRVLSDGNIVAPEPILEFREVLVSVHLDPKVKTHILVDATCFRAQVLARRSRRHRVAVGVAVDVSVSVDVSISIDVSVPVPILVCFMNRRNSVSEVFGL